MMIRKGPFGHFAVEENFSGSEVFEYALEVIDDKGEFFLPVYINKTFDGKEIAFDFSGMMPINEFESLSPDAKHKMISLRRKSIGDLFLSINSMLDLLLNPAQLITDSKYVFTDKLGTEIKLCYLPLETTLPLKLSSINTRNLERLLNHSFFRTALTEDEISSLICSVSNNDEGMLVKTAKKIKESPISYQVTSLIELKFTKPDDKLLISFAFCILSLISYYVFGVPIALISLVFSLTTVVLYVRGVLPSIMCAFTTKQEDNSERIRMFFDDTEEHNMNCAFLESIKPVDGAYLKYAIYQDCTVIGSDRFLSDFYIDNQSISPIHAQIFLTQDTVYLSDYSANGSTYIDDKPIIPENKYEVKNNQKIRFGNIDFKIKISFV